MGYQSDVAWLLQEYEEAEEEESLRLQELQNHGLMLWAVNLTALGRLAAIGSLESEWDDPFDATPGARLAAILDVMSDEELEIVREKVWYLLHCCEDNEVLAAVEAAWYRIN